MSMIPSRFWFLCCLLALTLAVSPAQAVGTPSAAALKQKIQEAIASRPQLAGGRVGIYIKVLKTDRVLYNNGGNQPMIPASNLKLATTAAALDLMGPQHRLETRLLGPAAENGVIEGDLILRGGGDPSFCYPYHRPSSEPLRYFVRQLRKAGVTKIVGDVVADDSAFDRQFLGQGWHDRYLLDSYAAPVSALSLNANLVELTISTEGITTVPSTPSLNLINKVTPGGGGVWVERQRGSDDIIIKGSLRPGAVAKRTLTIHNATLFTGGTFLRILKKGGLAITGSLKALEEGQRPTLSGLTIYGRFQSPPLLEMVERINKESDNLFAEHIFKALAFQAKGFGSAANGELAVKEFLDTRGYDVSGLKMVDGSGLSELNRISPRQLVDVLDAMWNHPLGQAYIDSLPAGGQGTLRYRLNGLTVRAKTGTLKGHSGLTGYVVSSYGQTLAFSVLVNDVPSTWSAIDLEDHIVKILATWPQPL